MQLTKDASLTGVSALIAAATTDLKSFGDTPSDSELAISIARRLLIRSQELLTSEERRQQAELDRMLQHPEDKATLVQWTDQAFRTSTPARTADQLAHILDLQGVPRFFSPLDQALLRGFQSFGGYLPGVAVPMIKSKMRRETANVILPAEEDVLSEHLQSRQSAGIRMNVNFLGESLLGEQEAMHRLDTYSHALRNPQIECISVKISTLYSQISSLSRRHCIRVLSDRMEQLYRTATAQKFVRHDGTTTSKFVYLDMEEYRDMRLTADVLMATLDRPDMQRVRAGIALQAYLPDSDGVVQELIEWITRRVDCGGEPLTIRVVKGANLEMERVDASLGGWPQAPYDEKSDTDANYKRVMQRLLAAELNGVMNVGIASHNLFDIALGMLWADRNGALGRVQFEMLEGMANHQRRAVFEFAQQMLLYAPACRREDFLHAIGYLIRRLDENTGPANFLRHTFRLSPDSADWHELAAGFRASFEKLNTVPSRPRRTQDRNQTPVQPLVATHWSQYVNEPDTDWTLIQNVQWAEQIIASWRTRCGDQATRVPLVVAGQQIEPTDQNTQLSYDPSRPDTVVCRFAAATQQDVEAAIACAASDPTAWRQTSFEHRWQLLRGAAQQLRLRRGDLIGAAMADAGKTAKESDPEVSEAIDFTEFYPLTVKRFVDSDSSDSQGLTVSPRGAVVVVSPWNFPIAIPCGGIAAALAAGNTVILKPSSDTVLPAWVMCECFWNAGVPREALQFLPCQAVQEASQLVSDDRIDVVILTGGTATARAILKHKPDIELLAETGGKNATIITALSDRELAIKNVIQSAFGHAGQKCSATSLLLLEQEVFDDPKFRQMLADAASSLKVGSAWDLATRVGPLIRPPRGDLARGLRELEDDESWLVLPEQVDDNPHLIRPGIKWNVKPGSFSHRTEFFGPILSVIPFRKLEEAIAIANATGYGLTSGIESLDDREQQLWREAIQAGNLYINRGTTGAIVLRQPFGGVGLSAFGPGLKAGGPNYVVPLLKFTEQPSTTAVVQSVDTPSDSLVSQLLQDVRELVASNEFPTLALSRLQAAAQSIMHAAEKEFRREHDSVRLLGQDNLRRYLPVSHLRVRITGDEPLDDLLIAALSAQQVGCRAVFSFDEGKSRATMKLFQRLTAHWAGRIEVIVETDEELTEVIGGSGVDRLRYLCDAPLVAAQMRAICNERFVPLISKAVIGNGCVEPLWYLQEQSISFDYHRYGNLGRRAAESRRPLVEPA